MAGGSAAAAGGAGDGGSQGGAAAGGGGGFDWATTLGDGGKDLLPVVQTKGWKGPADAVKSYTELEKTLGADRIVLPGKDAKPEDWEAVYAKLGRPGKPEEYGFKPPAGIPEGIYDPKFAAWAQTAFHKAGLTTRQAAAVHDAFVAMSLEGHNARVGEIKSKGDAGEAELRKEWGGDYDKHVEMAKRARKALEVNDEDLSAIESAIGLPKLLRMFARLGGRMGEDSAVGSGGGGMNDPATELKGLDARKAERMKADPTWLASPEAQQIEKRRKELYEQMHPGMAS